MTQGVLGVLDRQILSGDIITKEGHADGALPGQLRVHEAGHPIPDERGVAATSLALDALRNLPDRGGGAGAGVRRRVCTAGSAHSRCNSE